MISRLDRKLVSFALFPMAKSAAKLVPAINVAGVLKPSKKPTQSDLVTGSNAFIPCNCVVVVVAE